MKTLDAIGICRNPYGFSQSQIRDARLLLCDEVERLARKVKLLDGIAKKLSEGKVQYVLDQNQNITGCIIPFELWLSLVEMFSEEDE